MCTCCCHKFFQLDKEKRNRCDVQCPQCRKNVRVNELDPAGIYGADRRIWNKLTGISTDQDQDKQTCASCGESFENPYQLERHLASSCMRMRIAPPVPFTIASMESSPMRPFQRVATNPRPSSGRESYDIDDDIDIHLQQELFQTWADNSAPSSSRSGSLRSFMLMSTTIPEYVQTTSSTSPKICNLCNTSVPMRMIMQHAESHISEAKRKEVMAVERRRNIESDLSEAKRQEDIAKEYRCGVDRHLSEVKRQETMAAEHRHNVERLMENFALN
jgi:hypothetical protein